MLFIGLVIGAVISGLLVYNIFWISFYKMKRNMKYLNATNGVSNSVLNIVQMGVVAFTSDGELLFNNKTSLKKLRVEQVPPSFSEFVNQFIEDKEIMMQLRFYESSLPEQRTTETEDDVAESEKLESVTTRVEIHNRIIQFHFSKPFFPQSTLRGWIVVIEDVTRAARQEQQRRLFVSTVSHELKTPLATINGYSESLIDWGLREKSPSQIFNDIMKINEESQRITAIIANLTFLSQIENNKEKLPMTIYRIDKAVQEICRKYLEDARSKGIRLYFESLTRNMPPVFGSQSMMEQMVSNLITNALKYSSRNTCIWVYIQAHETTVTIKVQDQGPGIPQLAAEKVFQPFFRVDETGSRAAGGSGLGLAIVKMMAEVQEGEVSLVTRCADDPDTENVREEVGSDFYITVPLARATFHETLVGIRSGAEREEVLYRKAKQYIEKVNEDEYDLGFDLSTISETEEEDVLMPRLLYIDEYDIIDEAAPSHSKSHTADPVSVREEPKPEVVNEIEPEIPSGTVQGSEPVSGLEAPVENAAPVTPLETAIPAASLVEQAVMTSVAQVPLTPEQPTPIQEILSQKDPVRIVPVQAKETPIQAQELPVKPSAQETADGAGEWVPLTKHGGTVLVPDPPALKHPILSKDQVGQQNAEKRRQAKTKKSTGKKPAASKEQEAETSVPDTPVVAPSATRSMLRQMTDPPAKKSSGAKRKPDQGASEEQKNAGSEDQE